MGLALLAFGVLLIWAAFTRRGDAVVNAFGMNLPAAKETQPPASSGGGGGGGGGGKNALTGSYTVGLQGGGAMTVNASDPQAAIDNVIANGGKPSTDVTRN